MTEEPNLDAAYALDGPDSNRALYKSWAESYDADFAKARGYRLPALVARAFIQAGGIGPVLDIGCGTGLVADHLPPELVIDGIDLSPDMLAQSQLKGRYRSLLEADLLKPLPLEPDSYRGILSAGTFTHGHVGPEALAPLVQLLAPGGVAALIVNAAFFEAAGFAQVLDQLAADGRVTKPTITEDRIYDAEAESHDAHADDTAFIVVFNAR